MVRLEHIDQSLSDQSLSAGLLKEVDLNEGSRMTKIRELVRKLNEDEQGAALIEYTVLLGILVVAVIAIIVAVGGWVNGKWSALNTQINP